MTNDVIEKAQANYEQRLTPATSFLEQLFQPEEDLSVAKELVPGSLWYRSLSYKTQTSWSRSRRVVAKVAYDSQGLKMRFVVTSLSTAKFPPGKLYTHKYFPRGERLWFSAMAYVLLQAFRQQCLARTPLATATVGTIRTLLLKLGARVLSSVRRVLISISSSCPYQDIFAIAYQRIQALPAPA